MPPRPVDPTRQVVLTGLATLPTGRVERYVLTVTEAVAHDAIIHARSHVAAMQRSSHGNGDATLHMVAVAGPDFTSTEWFTTRLSADAAIGAIRCSNRHARGATGMPWSQTNQHLSDGTP